jgi:thiopurine S-methyltransferase
MPTIDEIYWESRYQKGETGWDMGMASPALVAYAQQLPHKHLQILIPGCGNAHEAAALLELGFENITLLDIAESPLKAAAERFSTAIEEGRLRLVQTDFFEHQSEYDIILEQTFFCAIQPTMRPDYAKQMHKLLKPEGKLAGLLFKFPLTQEGPPFGGSEEEYKNYFEPYFEINTMEEAYNSIAPRKDKELFLILKKRSS